MLGRVPSRKARHLERRLCERKQLTWGTTWHAAGLVTQLRATQRMTELAKHTGELFGRLEEETGQATGFRRNGALRIATNQARYEEMKSSPVRLPWAATSAFRSRR